MSKIPLFVAAIALLPIAVHAQAPPEFMARIATMKDPAWDRSAKAPDYQRPEIDPDTPAPEEVLEGLQRVWQLAPPALRDRLMAVDQIFVPHKNAPFLLREHERRFVDPPGDGLKTYIVLPPTLPPTLAEYSDIAARGVLHWDSPLAPIFSADPNSVTMGYLYIIAHEVGHAEFDKLYRPRAGDPPDGKQLICNGDYFAGSWAPPVDIDMSSSYDTLKSRHLRGVQIADIRAAAKRDQDLEAQDLLRSMFSTRQWLTVMQAAQPEHDWVETFAITMLRMASTPLQELSIDGMNVLDMLNESSEARRKFDCIRAYLGGRDE